MADTAAPSSSKESLSMEFVRCDTRIPSDARRAVEGVDAVIHLAAWHSAHRPPASDASIFSVNVDGTFHILEACKEEGVTSLVFASSMAYGWHSIYAVSKVIGENLCSAFHEKTGASVAMLRYNEFIPRPYLEFGAHLLTNGVDRRDVSAATLASLRAVFERRIGIFMGIVHNSNNQSMPQAVLDSFAARGPSWCEEKVPGSVELLEKYGIPLPEKVEYYDIAEVERVLGWRPTVGFLEFLKDLKVRDGRHEDLTLLRVPSELPALL